MADIHPPKPTSSDEQHLQVLSIFHYVVATMYAVFGCFPVIHLSVGIMMLINPSGLFPPPPGGQPAPPMELFGAMFVGIALIVIALHWGLAALIFYGGKCLATRRRHTVCLVVAGVCCTLMPFGTVLGIFTIIVLIRPSVKTMFT